MPEEKNHQEFFDAGYLLYDYATYDAFNEKAREMYWKQAKEGLFDQGFDSWWCDSTEPFSGPDWGGAVKREPWGAFPAGWRRAQEIPGSCCGQRFCPGACKGNL